jgi:uncharacterized protein YkwD
LQVFSRVRALGQGALGALTAFCVSLLLVVAALHPAPPSALVQLHVRTTSGGFRFSGVESCFMKKINRIRARHGLSATSVDPQLGYVARRHAKRMARAQAVFHDDRFGERVTNWHRLGQNTGRGATCRGVTKDFMNEPAHRDIVLGPWNHIGVGVHAAGGQIYVQELYESHNNPGNIYNTP